MFGVAVYNQLVTILDDLIDQVGEDESHPLASMMDVLSALIENYEKQMFRNWHCEIRRMLL